jgi:16S rRNA (guanine966-N2)-methyltransferase
MKITTGILRGMNLQAPQGQTTRPTLSKVREALVNMLMHELGEAVIIDLFAGSGAIGLELASSGAGQVFFVEKDPKALKALRENINEARNRLLKQEEAVPGMTVINKDLLKAWNSFSSLPKAHVVWVDPPYAEGLYWAKLIKEKIAPFMEDEGKLIIEFDLKLIKNLDKDFYEDASWENVRIKKYGQTAVIVWRKKNVSSESQS